MAGMIEEDGSEVSRAGPYCIQWRGRTAYPEDDVNEVGLRSEFVVPPRSTGHLPPRKKARKVGVANRTGFMNPLYRSHNGNSR